jgi:hypothetical protein
VSKAAQPLRRRAKPSLGARIRMRWVLIVAGLAVLAYGGYVFVTLPQLRVRDIQVRIDGRVVTRAEVLDAARIDRSRNAWLLNVWAIARRIEAIPYVLRADIHRRPPADVDIAVTQRVPTACVALAAGTMTVDATLRVLNVGCVSDALTRFESRASRAVWPGAVFDDPGVRALLRDREVLAGGGITIRSLGFDRFGGLVAMGADGVMLEFGDDADLARKVALIAPIRRETHDRPLHAIDVRAPDTPVVRFSGKTRDLVGIPSPEHKI